MTTSMAKNRIEPKTLPTTGEVAQRLGVSEQRVQAVLRSTPGLRPQIAGGKRRWRPEEVVALEKRLAELSGGSESSED